MNLKKYPDGVVPTFISLIYKIFRFLPNGPEWALEFIGTDPLLLIAGFTVDYMDTTQSILVYTHNHVQFKY